MYFQLYRKNVDKKCLVIDTRIIYEYIIVFYVYKTYPTAVFVLYTCLKCFTILLNILVSAGSGVTQRFSNVVILLLQRLKHFSYAGKAFM